MLLLKLIIKDKGFTRIILNLRWKDNAEVIANDTKKCMPGGINNKQAYCIKDIYGLLNSIIN